MFSEFTNPMPPYENFERVGRIIAQNTIVTTLVLSTGPCFVFDGHILRLLDHLCKNRSIRCLELREIGDSDGELVQSITCLEPFFEKNDELKCIVGRKLNMRQSNVISLLVTILSRRQFSVEEIQLIDCKIGDEEIQILLSAFKKHPTIGPKKICLDSNRIGDEGCRTISEYLEDKRVEIELLSLSDNSRITLTGFQHIAKALAGRRRALRKLDVSRNNFGGNLLMAFVEAFSSDPDMIPDELDLTSSTSADTQSWRIFGKLLARRRFPMTAIRLGRNSISHIDLSAFVTAFNSRPRSTPKILDLLSNNINLRGDGDAMANLLAKPNCSLERLIMIRNDFLLDENSALRIIDSLVRNDKLQEFWLDTHDHLSAYVFDCLYDLVCDTRSIEASIFHSNHTLFHFGEAASDFGDIHFNLELNRNPNKAIVAYVKVIRVHFAFDFDFDLFKIMKPSVLVGALAFLNRAFVAYESEKNARRDLNWRAENNSLTIHYLMVKSVPALLGFNLI
mmetsp:Transcript_21986/g.43951  ORF Transcript_21986/g.43951 Transcript_21986/m.43951 type:complete len:507 (-) Transcript_21986:94-1614(-)